MTAFRPLLAWLGLAAPLLDSGICLCGCPHVAHRHYRRGTDCGICGAHTCRRYRPDDTVRLAAVCADHELIEAVLAGRIDQAVAIADPKFVGMLVALADSGRQA